MLHRNDQHHCTFSIIMSCKLALVKNIKMLLMYFGQKVRRLTGTSRLKQEPEYAAFCSFYFIEHFVWRSLVILLPATWLFICTCWITEEFKRIGLSSLGQILLLSLVLIQQLVSSLPCIVQQRIQTLFLYKIHFEKKRILRL